MNASAPIDPALEFDPDLPINWTPDWHSDVTVWPWAENEPKGYKRAAGMFDLTGHHIAQSHSYRYAHEPMTIRPVVDDTPVSKHLKGRWLFGGVFYAHFGHFLVETTSRLWAAERAGDIAGILFYPKQHYGHELRAFRPYRGFFEKLGLGHLKIRIPQNPVTVDEIAFPPPAFGIGDLIEGRPDYREFMRERLTHGIASKGPDSLYVSRSGLTSRRGRIVMEDHLEMLMTEAGYTIFHPQEHSLESQIAHYRAAKRIVAPDGSALHLAAMVISEDAEVAIVNRGPSMNIEDYLLQFRRFAGIEPARIEAISGCWSPAGRRFVKREAQARLDVAKAGADLAAAGFINSTENWTDPPETALQERLAAMSVSFDAPLEYRDLR